MTLEGFFRSTFRGTCLATSSISSFDTSLLCLFCTEIRNVSPSRTSEASSSTASQTLAISEWTTRIIGLILRMYRNCHGFSERIGLSFLTTSTGSIAVLATVRPLTGVRPVWTVMSLSSVSKYRSSEPASRSLPRALEMRRLKSFNRSDVTEIDYSDSKIGHTLRIDSILTTPSLNTKHPSSVTLTTVDPLLNLEAPPSSTTSISAPRLVKTSLAVVAEGIPEIFALVPTSNEPQSRISCKVSALSGMRNPIIPPDGTSAGNSDAEGTTIVNPPGQKLFAS